MQSRPLISAYYVRTQYCPFNPDYFGRLYVFLSSLSQSYAAQCDNHKRSLGHKTIDSNSTVKNNLINTILTMLY